MLKCDRGKLVGYTYDIIIRNVTYEHEHTINNDYNEVN